VLVPLLAMALEPAFWDRADEGAEGGRVKVLGGGVFEAAGGVRVRR